MSSNSPPLDSPYHSLAAVLHELCWLAAEAVKPDGFPPNAAPPIARINPITEPWGEAKALARRTSNAHGIPLATFDPVLIDAEAILQELVQVAAGNKSVPFNFFDRRYTAIEDRLKELGQTYAGAAATTANVKPQAAKGNVKAGRKQETDPNEDERIYEGWKASGYRKVEEYATKHALRIREVKLALDRHKKRLNRAKDK